MNYGILCNLKYNIVNLRLFLFLWYCIGMSDDIVDEYKVRVERNGISGHITKKIWTTMDGTPHRIGKPSNQEFHAETGKLLLEEYMRNGVLSRPDDMPAVIIYTENGSIQQVEHWLDGRIHRANDKPAVIRWNLERDETEIEEYYVHGQKQNSLSIPDTLTP